MSSEFESGRQAFIKMFIPHLQHSVKPYDKDFHKTPNFERPHISSKITGKQVYVTPYYVSTGVEAFHAMGFKGKEVKLGIIDTGINLNTAAFKENYKYYRNLES
ncbi:hypothetical protein BDF19DRAFT_421823 [Syncephalis fuscata]|nr:hypothetical protein BDF19DRAFT_421823 [Syncephalis fuscata]